MNECKIQTSCVVSFGPHCFVVVDCSGWFHKYQFRTGSESELDSDEEEEEEGQATIDSNTIKHEEEEDEDEYSHARAPDAQPASSSSSSVSESLTAAARSHPNQPESQPAEVTQMKTEGNIDNSVVDCSDVYDAAGACSKLATKKRSASRSPPHRVNKKSRALSPTEADLLVGSNEYKGVKKEEELVDAPSLRISPLVPVPRSVSAPPVPIHPLPPPPEPLKPIKSSDCKFFRYEPPNRTRSLTEAEADSFEAQATKSAERRRNQGKPVKTLWTHDSWTYVRRQSHKADTTNTKEQIRSPAWLRLLLIHVFSVAV